MVHLANGTIKNRVYNRRISHTMNPVHAPRICMLPIFDASRNGALPIVAAPGGMEQDTWAADMTTKLVVVHNVFACDQLVNAIRTITFGSRVANMLADPQSSSVIVVLKFVYWASFGPK